MKINPIAATLIVLVPGAIWFYRKRWIPAAAYGLVYLAIAHLWNAGDEAALWPAAILSFFLYMVHMTGIAARLAAQK